jgi:hypothetical protein
MVSFEWEVAGELLSWRKIWWAKPGSGVSSRREGHSTAKERCKKISGQIEAADADGQVTLPGDVGKPVSENDHP